MVGSSSLKSIRLSVRTILLVLFVTGCASAKPTSPSTTANATTTTASVSTTAGTAPVSAPPTTHATVPPTTARTAPATTVAPTTTATTTVTTASTVSCHPMTSSGNCYEPGEFCSDADHGEVGVAGDGKTITCEDNDGWRWEP